MTEGHRWIVSALRDIRQVCEDEGFDLTSDMLRRAVEVALLECVEVSNSSLEALKGATKLPN